MLVDSNGNTVTICKWVVIRKSNYIYWETDCEHRVYGTDTFFWTYCPFCGEKIKKV